MLGRSTQWLVGFACMQWLLQKAAMPGSRARLQTTAGALRQPAELQASQWCMPAQRFEDSFWQGMLPPGAA